MYCNSPRPKRLVHRKVIWIAWNMKPLMYLNGTSRTPLNMTFIWNIYSIYTKRHAVFNCTPCTSYELRYTWAVVYIYLLSLALCFKWIVVHYKYTYNSYKLPNIYSISISSSFQGSILTFKATCPVGQVRLKIYLSCMKWHLSAQLYMLLSSWLLTCHVGQVP